MIHEQTDRQTVKLLLPVSESISIVSRLRDNRFLYSWGVCILDTFCGFSGTASVSTGVTIRKALWAVVRSSCSTDRTRVMGNM